MTVVDYLDAVKERLLADRVVGQFHIIRTSGRRILRPRASR